MANLPSSGFCWFAARQEPRPPVGPSISASICLPAVLPAVATAQAGASAKAGVYPRTLDSSAAAPAQASAVELNGPILDALKRPQHLAGVPVTLAGVDFD